MYALSRVQKLLFATPALAAMVGFGTVTLSSMDDQVAASEAVTVAPSDAETDAGYFAASNCTYYNNALHTTMVGQFGHDCCNNAVAWGKKSPYSVCGGCFPCIPPPP